MLPDYSDIESRLGDPLWWDQNGVPRYEPFHPRYCGVYAHYATLMIVTCQNCGRQFRVGIWRERHIQSYKEGKLEFVSPTMPTVEDAGSFYYGDPPRHDTGPTPSGECPCGDTMTSDPRQILEFWRWTGWDWERVPELEFQFHIPSIEEWDTKCGFVWNKGSSSTKGDEER